MKKLKLLAVGMVLTLTGAVYAFTGAQAATDSCPMGGGDVADCCKKAVMDCCKKAAKSGETCPFCKKK
jgi:hypothetical protein